MSIKSHNWSKSQNYSRCIPPVCFTVAASLFRISTNFFIESLALIISSLSCGLFFKVETDKTTTAESSILLGPDADVIRLMSVVRALSCYSLH